MDNPKIKADKIHYLGEDEIITTPKRLDPEERQALRMMLRSRREDWHKFIDYTENIEKDGKD
jgi:hypothetical protein